MRLPVSFMFERVCCSSLTYVLRSQPGHDCLTLQMTGPAEQIDSMRSIFVPASD
ncbi:MAG TPA: hypothetical protein VGD64_10245 [Acidisarcina sp.]